MQETSKTCKQKIINATTQVASAHHSFLLEIDSDGGYESGVEGAVGVLIKEARFADARVPEGQELYQVVVIHSVVNTSVEDRSQGRLSD